MLRFVNNLKSRSRQQERNVEPLNPPEILKAEHAWLQTVQQQFIVGDPKFKMLQNHLDCFMMKTRYFVVKEEFLMPTYPMFQSFQQFYQRIII